MVYSRPLLSWKIVVSGEAAGLQIQLGPPAAPGRFDSCDLPPIDLFGTPVAQLCREHGMSNAGFCTWRSRFGGIDTSMMTCLKELEDENRRLKKMYAGERLKAEIIQETMAKK